MAFVAIRCQSSKNVESLNGEWDYSEGFDLLWTKEAVMPPDGWKSIQIPQVEIGIALGKTVDYASTVTLKKILPTRSANLLAAGKPVSVITGQLSNVSFIYFNDHLVGQAGSLNPYRPGHIEQLIVNLPSKLFYHDRPNALYFVLINNGDYILEMSGVNIEIGETSEIYSRVIQRVIIDTIQITLFSAIGFYHLLLAMRRIKDIYNLFYGLFSLFFSIYILCNSELAQIIFKGYPLLRVKIDQISLMILGPTFLLFLSNFFYNRNSRLALFWGLICGIMATVDIFASYHTIMKVMLIWQITLIILLPYLTFLIISEILKKNRDAYYMTLGIFLIVIGIILDLMTDLGFLAQSGIFFTGYSFLIFNLGIAAILANRFVRVHGQSEALNFELDKKNGELVRLDQLKDEFLANTSHELRTPLNGIIGLAESTIADPKNYSMHLRNAEVIVSSGKRLSSLVNDILDFSKLKNSEIQLSVRAVDLRQISQLAISFSKQLARVKGLELHLEMPDELPLVEADEDRLQQILLNLIGNAIKFTHQGSVTIKGEDSKDYITVQVIDTGIGIPKEKLGIIFESFQQADGSISRQYGGTGLGLSIVKSLVKLHGSDIYLDSQLGQGSIFSFVLKKARIGNQYPIHFDAYDSTSLGSGVQKTSMEPKPSIELSVKKPFEPTELKSDSPHHFRKKYTVLVVDDEPVNVMVLENHLKSSGLKVEIAYDGFSALDKLKTINPDVILLDLMMPRMSGIEVCLQIRIDNPPTALPIVILSAKNQITDLIEALESGANDYLTKPFSRGELIARLQVHLQLQDSVKEKIKESNSFERFVPSRFLEILDRQSVSDVALGDSKLKNMSILFSDIRSFTSLSEKMSPEENFKFLNSYLKRMEPAINSNHGFVDKFIGDAIMALFESDENQSSADRALAAAIGMRRALDAFNHHRVENGFKKIDTGIGINCGSLVLGTVGSSNRMSTTVIGNTVNLAARLETLTAFYKAKILISDFVLKELQMHQDVLMREIGSIIVKGKVEPVGVIEVFEMDDDFTRDLKEKSKGDLLRGIIQFKIGNFNSAIEYFSNVLELYPSDTVASVYLQRCRQLIHVELPKNWQGVLEMTEK